MTMEPILMRSPTSDDNCCQQAMSRACAVCWPALNRETCLHPVERVHGLSWSRSCDTATCDCNAAR